MAEGLEDLTKIASGTLGASQGVGVDICVITDPGPGRYKIWGTARHEVADGCRLLVGSTTVIANICAAAGVAQDFGEVVFDVLTRTDDIILELATATTASGFASGTLYAQRLDTQ